MTVYSYCIALANEKDRLYEPFKQLWRSRQCLGMGSKHVLFKSFECSSFQYFVQVYMYKRFVRID